MKQQCYLAAIYLNWVIFAGGLALFLFKGHYVLAVAWFAFLPIGLWLYVRAFPSISQAMGYGKVDDHAAANTTHAPAGLGHNRLEVTLYTALGCPFCPIVKKRLLALREQIGFDLREVDVTLRPGVLAAKHIRAVPVVEVEERRIEGNTTSEELAELLFASAGQAVAG